MGMSKRSKTTVKAIKTWRWTATNQLSNKKQGALSRNFSSNPEPEVVLAAILFSESAKYRESAQRRWRNVESLYLVTKVQFGVPVPDRK